MVRKESSSEQRAREKRTSRREEGEQVSLLAVGPYLPAARASLAAASAATISLVGDWGGPGERPGE